MIYLTLRSLGFTALPEESTYPTPGCDVFSQGKGRQAVRGRDAFFLPGGDFLRVMGMGGKSFPTFAVLILVLALIWLAVELQLITVNIPWLPLIVVLVAAGWIVNHYSRG